MSSNVTHATSDHSSIDRPWPPDFGRDLVEATARAWNFDAREAAHVHEASVSTLGRAITKHKPVEDRADVGRGQLRRSASKRAVAWREEVAMHAVAVVVRRAKTTRGYLALATID